MEGKRPRRSNYKVFSASIARTDAAKLDARAAQYDRYTNMFVYMGAHDDTWDFTVMQITLEAALKTRYKEQVEEATVKECLNITSVTSRRLSTFAVRSMRRRLHIPASSPAAWLSRTNATQRENSCHGKAGSAQEATVPTQRLTSPLTRLPRQQAWTRSTWYLSSHSKCE